jgi:hypothetical protein
MPLVGKCTMACYAMPAAALILSRTKRSANMILKLHYFESALPIRSVRFLEPNQGLFGLCFILALPVLLLLSVLKAQS